MKGIIVVCFMLVLLVSLTMGLVPMSAGAQETSEVILQASKDSFLRKGNKNTNEGANHLLAVQKDGHRRAVIAFDLSGVQTTDLEEATLVLTIAEPTKNWGKDNDRLVNVHRLTETWTEGNGFNFQSGGGNHYRGDGPGVTWNCATDADISNQKPDGDCDWDGGWLVAEPATAPGVLHINDMTGEVEWDVTADIIAVGEGATEISWLVKKEEETKNGKVLYYSREGAAETGNASFAPRLVLTYRSPNITLTSSKDSFLRKGNKNTNEGANPFLIVQQPGHKRAVVGFDLSEVRTTGLGKAILVLTIAEPTKNWGRKNDRYVSAHRLTETWVEGNGRNWKQKREDRIRGDGPGVTWSCAIDADISNKKADGDCGWEGGWLAAEPATAPSVLHVNGMTGEVEWDVTTDVLAAFDEDATEISWLLKKERDRRGGKVIYYSKEGAAVAGDMTLAPRLILEY